MQFTKQVEIVANALDELILELLILKDIEALIPKCFFAMVDAFYNVCFIKISGQSESDRIV